MQGGQLDHWLVTRALARLFQSLGGGARIVGISGEDEGLTVRQPSRSLMQAIAFKKGFHLDGLRLHDAIAQAS
jgi:hypothetical protein